MTTLSGEQRDFLRKRRIMAGTWRAIGPVLVVAILIFAGMLLLAAPMLINPFAVMNRLQADSIDVTTLQTMAIMLPIAMCVLCVVLLALIAFAYAAFNKERRLLQLIDELQQAAK